MKVLVPDDLGVKTLETSTNLEAVRYEPGQPWPAGHLDATVVVVGYESAAAVGSRFVELPDLRLVQTLNAGYEQWLPYLPDGVILSNARGAHGGSSAEWVVAVLLVVYRNLNLFTEQQSRGVWLARNTETLIGKRIVVLGAGDLAVNLASRLAPFEAEVTLVGRRPRPGVHGFDDIDRLLPGADVVVAMLPADDSTRHVIDSTFLANLRDGALVVNVGRGSAVDTDALLVELSSGRLRAALDVTDPEPLPQGHPLWSAPGVLLTPHVAGSTTGAWERAWEIAHHQIDVYAGGALPPNRVPGTGRR
ncbi:2-hydroxyacid dehydrogenase [Mycobacterium sp. 48b]|uniref:2-hydroxyacid dehydrogenase n=1 Tax=Mycobacterium sp. 48b TaxID=3400426 RepID=UPI003AAE7A11